MMFWFPCPTENQLSMLNPFGFVLIRTYGRLISPIVLCLTNQYC